MEETGKWKLEKKRFYFSFAVQCEITAAGSKAHDWSLVSVKLQIR